MWKVLVVDDVFLNRKLVEDILREQAVCDLVESGGEALEKFEASIENDDRYDVILLDIAMPEMDGMTVLEKIRTIEEERGDGHRVGIIMVTAFSQPVFDAFPKGCDDYIVKPVKADELREKITRVLSE